jgi:hypothetical protein
MISDYVYTRIYVHLAHIQYLIHFLNIIQRSSTLTFTFLLYYYLRGRQYGLYESTTICEVGNMVYMRGLGLL